MSRSCRTGYGCYCGINTLRAARAGLKIKKVGFAERKTPKGGQRERTEREVHDGKASRVKNFRRLAMLQTAPLDCD
jgi:hypothetical protein